ncbi:MAG: DnaJ [Cryophage ML09]|nr:MAG: DnaJ [Cryophage ML09]
MPYITANEVKEMRKQIKELYPNIKVSVTKNPHSSTVNCYLLESDIDFGLTYQQVNHYYIGEHYTGAARSMLEAISTILHQGHFDKSDSMTDYFYCSWYIHIQIGKYDHPYVYKQSDLHQEITELLKL